MEETTKTVVVFTVPEEDEWSAIIFEHKKSLSTDDMKMYMRRAVSDFLKSDDGKKIAKDNGGDFNWGDAVIHVPNDIWKRHGLIAVLDGYQVIGAHHDENLYTRG